MNAVEISQVATAIGTLVLAVATYASIRAARASTRLAERALLSAQRPLLIPSRVDDPPEKIRFGDGLVIMVGGYGGVVEVRDGAVYLAVSLRNGGPGMAVLHAWRTRTDSEARNTRPGDLDRFRPQLRDLYIPAGSPGFWQGAIRGSEDPDNRAIRTAADRRERILVDLLHSDQDGGQRAVARFALATHAEDNHGRAEVIRYWAIDGSDPRAAPEAAS
jgi:hypothetical protein